MCDLDVSIRLLLLMSLCLPFNVLPDMALHMSLGASSEILLDMCHNVVGCFVWTCRHSCCHTCLTRVIKQVVVCVVAWVCLTSRYTRFQMCRLMYGYTSLDMSVDGLLDVSVHVLSEALSRIPSDVSLHMSLDVSVDVSLLVSSHILLHVSLDVSLNLSFGVSLDSSSGVAWHMLLYMSLHTLTCCWTRR